MIKTLNTYIQATANYASFLVIFFWSISVYAQERWFQIEVTIFSNEASIGSLEEEWEPKKTELDYPANIRRINLLSDLFLTEPIVTTIESLANQSSQQEIEENNRERILEITNPKIMTNQTTFKLFDFERGSYLQLSPAESDFQQTNRALQRSNDYRLLYHGLWRQPVTQESRAIAVLIEGGLTYGNRHELQGSLMIRFNENEDRVVIDANVWLTEFSITQDTEENWFLPEIPEHLNGNNSRPRNTLDYFPQKIYHMNQTRDMRSMEFHYLDHPRLGLIVLVKPYDVPPIALD